MNYKKAAWMSAFLAGALILAGCQSDQDAADTSSAEATNVSAVKQSSTLSLEAADYITEISDAQKISLDAQSGDVKITKAGTYQLSGTLKNGSVIVDAKDAVVRIVLNNAHIESKNSAPVYVKHVNKVIITLPKGTSSSLKDTAIYTVDEKEEPSAALFSKDDLTINGSGTLDITASYKNGIQCKDTLKLVNTNLNITAENDGIKAKDALLIYKGSYMVKAQGDGIVTTNEKEQGNLSIDQGTFVIEAQQDGLQSASDLTIYDGVFTVTSGGGSVNKVSASSSPQPWGEFDNHDETTETSQKGIKAAKNMVLYKGSYTISSHDDALHTNGSMDIKDGTYTLSSDDDGMHADVTLTIRKGSVQIKQSYEGLEANTIQIKGGKIQVKARDDGINAAGNLGNPLLTIDGGTIYVDADGDGVDSNQDIVMNDGTLIVMGPENGGNGALDYDGSFAMNGGTLVAVGSSDMAMAPSASSKQPSLMIRTDSTQNAETILYVQDEVGKTILGVSSVKAWQNVVISTGTLNTGSTYDIYVGGSASSVKNGIITNAKGGMKLTSMILIEAVTTYGNAGIPQGGGMHP